MEAATNLKEIADGLWCWQAYDPAIKADLTSTAFRVREDLVIVDPIPLAKASIGLLDAAARPCSIVVTNGNHARAAAQFRERLGIPVLAHRWAVPELGLAVDALVENNDILLTGVRVLGVPGAGPGEVALHCEPLGLMIVGDALINLPPYGFTFLPDKYCQNPTEMRHALRALLDHPFEAIAFAHGAPLCGRADEALRTLLDGP